MTTRVRTGEKIYRGLFLELSPSVSFETAGHHDPDHVQSAGGREKEGFGRVGEVGERETGDRKGVRNRRRSNKREFQWGRRGQDRLLAPILYPCTNVSTASVPNPAVITVHAG